MTASTIDRTVCRASQHGTRTAYSHGCRCPEAYEACRPRWREKSRERAGIGRRQGHGGARRSDVDEVAVDMACGGEFVPLTVHEIRAAVARLVTWHLSVIQIAERLHISPRTVQRHRTALRAAGGAR